MDSLSKGTLITTGHHPAYLTIKTKIHVDEDTGKTGAELKELKLDLGDLQ